MTYVIGRATAIASYLKYDATIHRVVISRSTGSREDDAGGRRSAAECRPLAHHGQCCLIATGRCIQLRRPSAASSILVAKWRRQMLGLAPHAMQHDFTTFFINIRQADFLLAMPVKCAARLDYVSRCRYSMVNDGCLFGDAEWATMRSNIDACVYQRRKRRCIVGVGVSLRRTVGFSEICKEGGGKRRFAQGALTERYRDR